MMLGLILKSITGTDVTSADGYCPLFRGPADTCGGAVAWSTHLVLPWLTFGLLFLALYTRMVRASVAETIQEDFVRTARAKGASQSRVLYRHVLPSASVRVLTMVGMEIGTAIGVCIYIESAYHIDGLAHEAVQVIGGAGAYLVLPAALAVVVLITLVVVVGNFVVDVFCAVLDPRIALHGDPQRTKSFAGGVF
jgi:peptide/nickel transport system permease protein